VLRVKSIAAFAVLLLVAVCLSSCAPLLYHAHDSGYAGLDRRLGEAATNGGKMHIVVVHGIGDHAIGYSEPLADALAAQLKLASQNDSTTNDLINTNGITVTNFLREYSFRDGQRTIVFHEVTWTPTTTNIKVDAFAKDLTLNRHRVLVNRSLKTTLMDESLPDAVLYMNPGFRPRMQAPILDTIKRVGNTAGTNDVIVLIASSLGSKMIFDSAIESETNAHVERFIERTTDIIMLANQLPLLHLGSGTDVGNPSQPPDTAARKYLRSSKRLKTSRMARRGPPANRHEAVIHVVAATDPNDLLSYPLTAADVVPDDNNSGDVKVTVSNIYAHNAWSILFLFENPEAAHDNYDQNSWLIKKLVRGYGDQLQ